MIKKLKNMDKRSRSEQVFMLGVFCVFCFGILCVSGCGGSSCETIKCGGESGSNYSSRGISIPGIGAYWKPGCGEGCNNCLWAQSCKFLEANSTEDAEDSLMFIACDTDYYTYCGDEKSCYSGFMSSDEINSTGLFYGSSETGHIVGCIGGCVGCFGVDNYIREVIDLNEYRLGID